MGESKINVLMNKRFKILTIGLIFIVLGIIYTYPLVCYFTKGMPYSHYAGKGYEVVPLIQGDYLHLYYKMWLFKDAVCGQTPFFSDPYQFNINDTTKAFSTQFLPLSFIFTIFSCFGMNFAYNVLVILSFVLAGVSMYLLVRFYTQRDFPAFIGGLIFSLAPFRLAQLLGGHPNGFLFFLIPLTVYFLEMAFLKRSVKYSIFSGLCIFSLALMELHLMYYLTLFLIPFIVLGGFIDKQKGRWECVMPVLFFMLLSFLWVYFSRGLGGSIAAGGRRLMEVKLHSPSISDLFKRVNPKSENFIYLGIIPLLLTAFSFRFCFLRNARETDKGYYKEVFIVFYFLVFLATTLLSLGPSMDRIFPLYRLAYKFVPYFNYPRASARIIVFAFLSLSILAGFGIKWMGHLKLGKKIKFPIFTILLLGILADYFPARPVGISLLPQKENEVYSLIKEDVGSQRLLELPIWPGDSSWSSLYLYYITKTHARVINGYCSTVSNKYVEDIFIPLYNLDFGEMRKEQYSLLKKLNVKYIILHGEAYPYKVSPYPFFLAIENLKNSRYIEFVKHDDPLWLFKLLDIPPEFPQQVFSQSSVIGTLYEAERLPHRGQVERDDRGASGKTAVSGDISKDNKDYLVFGPYRTFPTGRYKVLFRLKTNNNLGHKKVARIEVSIDEGREIIKRDVVYSDDFDSPNTYRDFILPFELRKPQRLEFRVWFYKEVNLWIDYVYVLFADQQDPLFSYEAEDLFHIARVIFDSQAHKERTIYADVSLDPQDYLNTGPHRRYPPGRYRAYFRLKIDNLTEDEIARIEITTDGRREKLASRAINGVEFEVQEEFKEFAVTFDLKAPQVLEFLVFFSGNSNLWFDSVRIQEI